jgi:hypothetical protein
LFFSDAALALNCPKRYAPNFRCGAGGKEVSVALARWFAETRAGLRNDKGAH